MKKAILLLVFFALSYGKGWIPVAVGNTSYAQPVKKADSYFNNYEYARAIPLYKKASRKSEAALRKLADCYRITKNYSNAEKAYAELASKNSTDPMVYYYYGEALLNNNKYEEAKKQFAVYSTLNPDDKKGELYAKACDDIKSLLVKPSLYKVYNLGELNSAVSDFCPVLYKDGIVFSSERVRDLVSGAESNWTGNPYLSIVYAKAKRKKDTVVYSKAELFSEKLGRDGHYGPACFSADFSEMYFTMAGNSGNLKRGAVSQPKLYFSKHGSGWSKPVALSFSSDAYATGHPSISADGQFLYFSSSMPGGKGGTDIWVSKREGSAWGTPQNLGAEVNTSGDESFPYIGAGNTLYFSSNGHAGFGGLDVFSSMQKSAPDAQSGGKWNAPNNLMFPVNSTADDFGIIFTSTNTGYFSSNRAGGKGSDDLYGFGPSGMITSISGKILLSNKSEDGAQNVKVFLLADKGTILQTTSTDRTGFFKFENLLADQTYMVRVDESDPALVNQKRFYLADVKNKVVRVVVKGDGGFFIFENLPPDLTKLTPLNEDDVSLKNISIAGNMYAGDSRTPLENTKINLVNAKGEIIQSTTTNAFGSFVFMNISPDENLTVTLDASDPKLASQKIYFTNKSGTEIASGFGKSFRFQLLASDKNTLALLKVEDSQLLVDLNGTLYADKIGIKRLSNSDISLVDEQGNVVRTSRTDASGNFRFVNLPADKNYTVRLREDDPTLSSKDIYLADTKGRIVATLKSAGKFFRYAFLPVDEQTFANIYFDDPWLKVAKMQASAKKDSLMTIIENVYYEYQKWDLLPQTVITLNKVIGVLKENPDVSIDLISHTDSRGGDDFNQKLSQKRAQTAVEYIISKGISKTRLVAKGLGESRLVNNCKDGIECSEDEHAQNRRTEFKVKKKGS